MNNKLMIIGIFFSILVILCFYEQGRTEKYNPFLNPEQTYTAPTSTSTTLSAPWIPKKTPMPAVITLDSPRTVSRLLRESVDPGAHLECQQLCVQKSGKVKSKQFMQVCIDTCIQEKWTNPNSKLSEFKP